jgi:hypothetical protein
MRKTLLTLTALAGLVGAGAIGTASAETVGLETVPAAALVRPAQFYGYHHGYHRGWHHRRWVEYHRWHHWHHGYRRW